MEDISLHILDIVENAITADASKIEIMVIEDRQNDLLTITIKDNGKGMDEEIISLALDPFFTSKPEKRIGLGLPLFAQAARESGGGLEIESKPDGGTEIIAKFRMSHPDRKPLGDIQGTLDLLRITHPEIDFLCDFISHEQKRGVDR